MNKMKRGLKQSNHGDVDAKERMKHQNLLQEYLELQKEFVSRKKKLQTAKEKMETLLADVRFLRARHGYLLKMQPNKVEIEQDPAQAQNLSKQSKRLVKDRKNGKMLGKGRNNGKILANDRNCGVDETVLNPSSPLALIPIMGDEKDDDLRALGVEQEPLRVGIKPKNSLINGKKIGKKKISWQDPVALQV